MTSAYILSVTTFIYAFAAVLYFSAWIFRKSLPGKTGTGVTIVGILTHIAGILLRWMESYKLGIGHAPFSNLYESLVFFSLTIAALYLYIEIRYKNRVISAFAGTMAFLTLAYAALKADQISPLIPALKSNWLIAHVITCFLGYAGFAVAFGISILYFIKHLENEEKQGSILSLLPQTRILDELTYQMVVFGFFFLTIGIITGAVWANSAWGRYWGWDPKETWSLVTWFVYAILLHARLIRGWQGKRIALISIIGFTAVMFTYFGVNYLPGLHSYGKL